ncbi:MAG: hypothetical protein V2A76_13885 [Planctomycetota bacterium]
MRRLVSLLVFSILVAAGCQQAALPVWYIPAGPDFSVAEVEARTSAVLARLGYEVAGFDPDLQMISTHWLHENNLLSTRFQALVRLKRTSPLGVAVTVPREVHDGEKWIPNGEHEQRRKELVASLAASLAPRGNSP